MTPRQSPDPPNVHVSVASTQTLVRITDKYAAFYPLAGILAEMVVLFLIIYLCERSKSGDDTVGGDEDEDLDYNKSKNGNTRQQHRRN